MSILCLISVLVSILGVGPEIFKNLGEVNTFDRQMSQFVRFIIFSPEFSFLHLWPTDCWAGRSWIPTPVCNNCWSANDEYDECLLCPFAILPICSNRYSPLLPLFLTLQNSSKRPTSLPRPAHPEDISILKPDFMTKTQTKLSSPLQRVSLVAAQRQGQRGSTGRPRGKLQTC